MKKKHKTSESIKIIFRCDASQDMGVGHVTRCLVLAEALTQQGAKCVFSTIAATLDAVPEIENIGYEVISPECFETSNPDFVVVDHYYLEADFFQSLKEMNVPCMIIDDLHEKDFYPCDLLLINNLSYCSKDYKNLVPENCQIFSGPEFILIHKDFLDFDVNQRKKQIPAEALFLFFGGTDPAHLTLRMLSIIHNDAMHLPRIDVVIGEANPDTQKIREICQSLKANLHIQIDNMAEIMAQADLAVGCGGTAIWERLSLRLPTLEISHSEWQIPTFQDLHSKRYLEYLGKAKELSDTEISNSLTKALEDGLNLRYCPCGGGLSSIAEKVIKLARRT